MNKEINIKVNFITFYKFYVTGKYMPNETVYKLGCKVFGLKWDKKEFKYKCNISSKINKENFKNEYGIDIDDMFNID